MLIKGKGYPVSYRYSIYQLALLLFIAAVGTVGAWQAYRVSLLLEQTRTDDSLRDLAQVQAFRAQDLLSDAEGVLEAYKAYFEASEQVTPEEYRQFSDVLLPNRNEVFAVHWAPKIGAHERAEHERTLNARGFAPLGIFEIRVPDLSPVAAPQHPMYFPITFSEPLARNRSAIGLNAAIRFQGPNGPVNKAIQGESFTTSAFPIIQDEDGPWAVSIFQPVYKLNTSDQRSLEQLSGFLLLLLRPEILLTERLEPMQGQPYRLRLIDISGETPVQIYPRKGGQILEGRIYSFPLELGDRQWKIDIIFETEDSFSTVPLAIAVLITLLTLVILLALGRSLRQSSDLIAVNTKLAELANSDPLTGLANRRCIEEIAQELMALEEREGSFSAICVVDLDNFKAVNDRFGHQKGDELLVELADLFRTTLRNTDVAARIGGDEFILLMPQLRSLAGVTGALERLLESLNLHTEGRTEVEGVSASIGVALSSAECRDFSKLQHRADQAMYAAKKAGKNRYLIWSPELANDK